MVALSGDKQADSIDAFNTTSRNLDDILNINNVYFDNMVSQLPFRAWNCNASFKLKKTYVKYLYFNMLN